MRLRYFLLVVTATAAIGQGCGVKEHAVDTKTAADTAVATDDSHPRDGGTLLRRLESDVNTLNPIAGTTTYEKQIHAYVHAPLVDLDKKHNIIPALAEKWEISPDGKTYTFHLDKRATFGDGRPVRASDVVFTLKKIADPKSESVALGPLFEGIVLDQTKALSDATVQVVFDRSRSSQLLAFNIPILPEHFYSRGNFTRDFNRKALGAGPYTLAEAKAGQHVRLERRKNYWREKPHIQTVMFKVIKDDTAAWNAVRNGELDESRLNSDQWKAARDDEALQKTIELKRFYLLGYNFIPWNTKDPILSDSRVRRALAMCLDRRSIIANLYYGTARIITGPYTPDQWAYNPDVKPIEFDPQGALKILNDAGWSDSNKDGMLDRAGRPLEIEILTPAGSATSAAQMQVFQDAAKKIGIDLELTSIDPSAMFERILSGKYQGAALGWDLDLDPDLFAVFHSSQHPPEGQNFVFFSNENVDKLIDEGRKELDQTKRQAIYRELHRILADEQPYLWIVQVSTKWAVAKRVRDVEESEGLGLFLWQPGPLQWWLGDAAAAPAPH